MEHARPDVRRAPRDPGLPRGSRDAAGTRDGWMEGILCRGAQAAESRAILLH